MIAARFALPTLALALTLGACASKGDIDISSGVGITAIRSACPSVGVVAGTGDITLFSPADSTDATAIDVTATMTDVRSTCNDQGSDIVSNVTFQVLGLRARADGARDVTLPYYMTVVRGGSQVVAKRIGQVVLHFEPGQARAQATGTATAIVDRSATVLPQDVRDELTRKRKAGKADAAVDPLSVPRIRDAVRAATFEALVGFQLTDQQLAYNATR